MDSRSLDADLRSLLASDADALYRADDIWIRLRDEAPVLRLGSTVYLTRYDHVKSVLTDLGNFRVATFSETSGRVAEELSATYSPAELTAFFEVGRFEEHYMNRSGDGEKHDRLRRIAHRYFTPARIAELRVSIGRYTDALIDEIVDDAVDGVSNFEHLAYRLPLMIICEMLGVPAGDRDLVHGWSNRIGRNRRGREAGPLLDARDALAEFRAYVQEILVGHRQEPASVSPLVATLVDANEEERLDDQELTAMFVILLFAGHETTTNLLANGVLALMTHRDQWARLCADPGMAGNATEELLRFVAPVQWIVREVSRPSAFDGVQVEPGDTVVGIIPAANRDPRIFSSPDELDLARHDARNHLSLGFGIHFCLGQALARIEGAMVLERLARRFPDMDMAVDPGDLAWRGHVQLRGLRELPVRLGKPADRM
jgi:cytochrome P450